MQNTTKCCGEDFRNNRNGGQAPVPVLQTDRIEALDVFFSVCKVTDYSGISPDQPFVFIGSTEEEKSLVCPTERVPENTTDREDGWRAFRLAAQMDFSLVGILARLSAVLADENIGIFAVSTFNTDYILVKALDFERALLALQNAGYRIGRM